jgi:hypothetical protein
LTEEKGLKEEGEELAKTAVASGLGSKQLGSLYRQTLTKPIPFVEAFVKRQIGRGVPGFPGALGDRMLALLRKYEENKAMLERALMYANMLYPYYEVQSMMALKETVESLVKRMTERFGFDGIEISRRGQDMEIRVRLARFYGNRAALASEISAEILRRVPEASRLSFRVWIEQAERR